MASLAAAALGLGIGASRAAAPPRLALVIGYGAYANLPALPICPRSSGAVSDALRKLGFEVTTVTDASNGSGSAALAAFARKLADPTDFAVVYACGYVTGFDGRPFMLPVSAELARPSDVLTQGMLARSFVNIVRSGTTPALVVLDAVPAPGGGGIGLGGMVHGEQLRPNLFLAAAAATDVTATSTALSAALVDAVAAPDADAAGILATLTQKLDAGASLATAGSGPDKARLTPPPPPPPVVEPPPPVAALAPPPQDAPPPAEVAPAVLGDADRRRVQTALRKLGLYPGAIDGNFGAETTSAIRRFQMVRGVDATGRLDAPQTQMLLGMVAKPP